MRVAMVSPRCPPLTGGVETHIDEVGHRLASWGIELTVLSTDLTGELPATEVRNGVRIERFPAWPRTKDYYVSVPLTRALRRGRFDLVHVQGVHTLLPPMALRTADQLGIPSVLTFHTGGSSSSLRNAVRSLQWTALRPFLRLARLYVAVCEYEIDLFAEHLEVPRSSFRLIRNGANALPVSDRPGPDFEGRPLILSLGRLERYKGHHRVIAAMPHILRAAPDARLVVVGSGPYEAELRRQVERLGVGSAVAFTSFGVADRDQLGNLVHRSDVVALLSEYEAHPVAMMEALAAGTEVVAADTSGLSELGRQGLARLIPLHASPRVVSRGLLVAAAQESWTDGPPLLPTWDDCAESLLRVYKEALADH